jgi:predicted TIM-barrel fold metal-dependent hydrolase
LLIVDSQIHLWNGGQSPPHHRQGLYLAEDAIAEMDAAGITAAINHPPQWDQASNLYAVEAARAHPDRFATLGWLKLDRPDAPEIVRRWREQPGMIGFRLLCMMPDERSWPIDGTMDWLWPLAEELNLPIALCGPLLLPMIEHLAPRHPGLKLTVDHLGYIGPSASPDVLLNQVDGLHGWAVKLTGLPDYARDAYPFRSLHGEVRRLYDAFGPERLFWGTDFTRLKCSWRECVTMYTEEMPWLSEADQRLILGEAFCTWHNWGPT